MSFKNLTFFGRISRIDPINRHGADMVNAKKATNGKRAGGKCKFSDEEIRRWRSLFVDLKSPIAVHEQLTKEGVSVAPQYLRSVLRGDLRPFA